MPRSKIIETLVAWAFFLCLVTIGSLVMSHRKVQWEKERLFLRNSELLRQVKDLESREHEWQQVSLRALNARNYDLSIGESPSPNLLKQALNPCFPINEGEEIPEACSEAPEYWKGGGPPFNITLDDGFLGRRFIQGGSR